MNILFFDFANTRSRRGHMVRNEVHLESEHNQLFTNNVFLALVFLVSCFFSIFLTRDFQIKGGGALPQVRVTNFDK